MKEEIRKTYYENGNIETERTFVDGVEHGPAKGWYESGELSFESFKKDGVPHGLVKNILDKIKNYSKKGLLTLSIIVSVVNNLSAQSDTPPDTTLLNQSIELADSTTQTEYARAMISLIQDEILIKKLVTQDTTRMSNLEFLLKHNVDISNGMMEKDYDWDRLQKADKLNNILNKKLLSSEDKLKYHMDRGEIFNWRNWQHPDEIDSDRDKGFPSPKLDE